MRSANATVPIILFILVLAAPAAAQWSLDAEGGLTWSGYNDVRIPGDAGTLLSLRRDLRPETRAFGRLRLSWQFHPRHTLSVLYAPLRFPSVGTLDRDVSFVDRIFPAGQEIQADSTSSTPTA